MTKSARSDVLKQFIIFFVFDFYPVSRRLSHRFVTLLTQKLNHIFVDEDIFSNAPGKRGQAELRIIKVQRADSVFVDPNIMN